MSEQYWDPDQLNDAIRLLKSAHSLLDCNYPYSYARPNPGTLIAVNAAIDSALNCLKKSRPTLLSRVEAPDEGPASD